MVKDLKKRTELVIVDVVKENNMAASVYFIQYILLLVTLILIFLLEMMLETVW